MEGLLQIQSYQIDKLKRENARLVEQLKEVIKMNTHWQRYDSQREEYVLKLTRRNQELQDEISHLHRQVKGMMQATSQLEKGKKAPREHSAVPSSGPFRKKEEEIAALKDHVSELKEKTPSKEEDELALLKEQVNICIDEFKQERKDRERLHMENETLREEIAQLNYIIQEQIKQLNITQEQIKQLRELRGLHRSKVYSRGNPMKSLPSRTRSEPNFNQNRMANPVIHRSLDAPLAEGVFSALGSRDSELPRSLQSNDKWHPPKGKLIGVPPESQRTSYARQQETVPSVSQVGMLERLIAILQQEMEDIKDRMLVLERARQLRGGGCNGITADSLSQNPFIDDLTDLPYDMEVDGIMEEPLQDGASEINPPLATSYADDLVLACPGCSASFKLADLIDHVEACLGHKDSF